MSVDKENIEQEVDLEALANTDKQNIEQQEEQQEEQHELSPVEQKAFDQGWRPQEEFNGPEENWKTPKEFIKDGEWLAQIKSLKQDQERQKQDFDNRLDNTNKLHEARRQTEITKLKDAQRNAVDMADTDAYDAASKQITELEKESQPTNQQPAKAASVAEWEVNNPWINDSNDERTPVTQAIWGRYLNQNPNATPEQALAHVDERINKLYPSTPSNPRREQPNITENNQRRSSRKPKSLSMNDLSADERQEWDLFGSQMFTEAEFLKTVSDTRTK